MMVDTITVLTSLSYPLTKTIVKTETGLATRTNQNVRYYEAEEFEVRDIRSMAALLEKISADPQKCVVRGAVAPGTNRTRMLRRKFAKEGEDATLMEVPHHWLLLDADGVGLAPGFDAFADPVETVRVVVLKLPACFHGLSMWYQFTAGAGVKPGLHIRLGFWLNRPLGESELKLWLGQRIPEPGRSKATWFKEFPVDRSFFGTVQPNYIAAPIIAPGAHDPLAGRCARSGFVSGRFDSVIVPPIEARPVQSSVSSGASVPIGSTMAECLAAIGDHEGGNGCHNALRHAVAVYYRRNGADASPEKLKDRLKARIAETEWDRAVHSVEYVQSEMERLDSLIDSIRGQQCESERLAEEERTRALCPWPDVGLTLTEAEPVLHKKVGDFFNQAVPDGVEQRAEYKAACEAFKSEVETRRLLGAEAEFGAIDGDGIFDVDPDPDEPEAPRYAHQGIKVTAGAGKTHATTERMVAEVQKFGRNFVYSVPTHTKAEEIADQANTMAGTLIAHVWRGIDRDDPGAPGAKMCRRSDAVKEVVKSLGSIADACGSAQRGYCPFHPAAGGPCAYRPQVELKPKIWIITHSTLATPPQPSMENADALIIDEALSLGYREDDLLISDFAATRRISSRLDGILHRAKRALERIAAGAYIPRAPFEEEGFTSETCAAAERCEAYGFERIGKTFQPGNADDEIVSKVEAAGATNRGVLTRQAYWQGLGELLDGGAETSARMRLLPGDDAAIRIASPWRPHPRWLDRPVLHIDATLDPTIVGTWLPRFELLADIRVERGEGVTVHQVIDQPVSYGRIIPGAGTDKSSEKRTSQQNNLQKIMRRIEVSAAEDRRHQGTTGLVAPKNLEDQMEDLWKLWGTQPANLLTGHFGALRGRNNLEDCRRIVVISRPEPTPGEIERLARIEFGHHASPEIGVGYYLPRPVALRTEGNARVVVQEAYHPDSRALSLLRQIRDAEVTQAVHRARPVRRGKDRPLVIEIVSGVPVDMVVDHIGSFDDWLETSPAHVLLARGIWPDAWEDKQAVLRDLYPTSQAVRRGFQENPTAAELRRGVEMAMSGKDAQTPYIDSLIRALGSFQDVVGWPCFRYRLSGARRSHVVAVDPVLHPDARSAWAARLGKPLEIFEMIGRPNLPGRSDPVASEDRLGGPPVVRPPAALSVASDVFGTDRRNVAAPPLPAAPLHLKMGPRDIRFWPNGGGGKPILMRSVSKPAQSSPPHDASVAEPLLTIEAIRNHVGVSAFALKTAMGRSKYRKLQGEERERAAIRWLTVKVGREQFIAAVRDLAATMKRGGEVPS